MTLKSLLGHVTFMAILREKKLCTSTQSPNQTIFEFRPCLKGLDTELMYSIVS